MKATATTALKVTNNRGWETEIPAGTPITITSTTGTRAEFRAPGKYYGATSLDNLAPAN